MYAYNFLLHNCTELNLINNFMKSKMITKGCDESTKTFDTVPQIGDEG